MSVIITLLLVASVGINVWLFKRKTTPGGQSVRSVLMQGIKNVKDLTTIRQNFQSVVMFSDSKAFLGFALPGTVRKFLLKYSGTITCGNDLSKIEIKERFAVNRVRIVVPHSKLLDVYADMKSLQVYDQKAGFFTSVQLEDQNREVANNLEEVRQETLQSDILRRADENTRALLISLAASMGLEAEVIFGGQEMEESHAAPMDPVLSVEVISEQVIPEEIPQA